MTSLNTDNILQLIQLQTILPLQAFSALSNVATSTKMTSLNKDIILQLIQLQTILPLQVFSSLSNIATSTPAAKHHQMIICTGRFAGWSHIGNLSSGLKTLPSMEQCAPNCCVRVASVWVQTLVACICHSACADTWCRCLLLYLEVEAELLPVCNGPYEVKDPMSTFHIKIFKTVAHG